MKSINYKAYFLTRAVGELLKSNGTTNIREGLVEPGRISKQGVDCWGGVV